MRPVSLLRVVVLCLVVVGAAQADDEPRREPFIRTVVEAYRSNRESFRQFSCRFRVTTGRADSEEAAFEGDYAVAQSWTGTWVVDRERGWERFSRKAPVGPAREKVLADARLGATEGRLPPSTKHFLHDGTIQLSHAALTNGTTLHGPGLPPVGSGVTPFGMGIMGAAEKADPPRVIGDGLDDGEPWTVTEVDESGKALVRIASVRRSADFTSRSYTFDPARGYSLAEASVALEHGREGQTTTSDTLVRVLEAREYAEAGWFPWHWIQVDRDEGRDGLGVLELRVLEFELGRPDEAGFRLALPEGGFVNAMDMPLSQYRLEKAKTVLPNDLPRLYERAMAAAEQRRANRRAKEVREVAVATVENRGWWRRWLAFGSIGLIGIAGIALGYRRYRARHA